MINENVVSLRLPYQGNDRLVRVYVPAHEEGETFPVIYMTDGQNLFEDDTVKFGCWYTPETIRAEQETSGQAVIIVGIHNDVGPAQRASELTPISIGELAAPDEMKKMMSPQGELFDDFIINTVMPAVESQFPVKTGRNNTAFCGSSCGGLFSFYTALSNPDKYCMAGVFSPVFMMYPTEDMRKWVNSKIQEKMPYLYIYTGGGDALERQICQSVEITYDMLTECYPLDKLNEVILLDQCHHEIAWEPMFKDFLHTFLTCRENY